jgi:protein subunit release factor A
MKETIQLEIRASEGGEDSKLLVNEMRDIYIKTAKNNNLN